MSSLTVVVNSSLYNIFSSISDTLIVIVLAILNLL
jgi:hypothetical protein